MPPTTPNGRDAAMPARSLGFAWIAAACVVSMTLCAVLPGCAGAQGRDADPYSGGSELTVGHEVLNVLTFPFRMIGYGLYYTVRFVFYDIWAGLFCLLFPPADGSAEESEIERLESGDRQSVLAACMSLGLARSERAAPAMLELLSSPDDEIRAAATVSLSMIKSPSITGELTRMARAAPDERVRAAAVRVMGFSGRPDAVFAVSSAMDDASWAVRAEAAVAAGRLKSWSAGPRMVSALRDQDPRVRGAAAVGLSYMGDRRALPALRDLFEKLDSEGTFVRAAVITALADLSDRTMTGRFSSIARGEGPLKDQYSVSASIWALGRLRALESRPLLRTILLETQAGLGPTEAAAQALGMLGDAEAIGAAAAHDEVIVRLAAVKGLIELGGAGAQAVLAELTNDPYSDVRQRAIVSLLQMGRTDAVPRMIDQLASPDVEIRAWAFMELKRISGKDLGLEPKPWHEWWEENSAKWNPALFYSQVGKGGS